MTEARSKLSFRDALAAKAALAPFSRQQWVLWLCFVVFVQSLWGLWPVCTRYLQTIPPDPAPTLQLTLMVNAIALPCTIILTYLPTITAAIWTLIQKMCPHQQQHISQQPSEPASNNSCTPARTSVSSLKSCQIAGNTNSLQERCAGTLETVPAAADCSRESVDLVIPDILELTVVGATAEHSDVASGDRNSRACHSSKPWSSSTRRPDPPGSLIRADAESQHQQQMCHMEQTAASYSTCLHMAMAVLKSQAAPYGIGILAASYNISIIYSASFINAYLVQLISLFTPLIIALCSSHLLRERTPPGLYITLFLALGGSAMVVSGHWLENRQQLTADSPDGKQAVLHLTIGLVLSGATVMFQAAYTLAVQVFRKSTTSQQVLIANRNVSILFCLPFAVGLEDSSWRWLHTLRPGDWGVLMFGSIVIYTFNTLWLTVCTRRVGANMFSIFVSLRLVASVVGSVVLLQSTPRSPITWAGFAVVLVVMTSFMLYQQRHGMQAAPEAAASANTGANGIHTAPATSDASADRADARRVV